MSAWRAAAVAAAAVLLTASPARSTQLTGPSAAHRENPAVNATVYFEGSEPDGTHPFGAGVILSSSGDRVAVLTAKHVATLDDLDAHFADGVHGEVVSVLPDRDADIALVVVLRSDRRAPHPPVEMSAGSGLQQGVPISVIGHPDGNVYTQSKGAYEGVYDGDLLLSCSCSFGDSGGGVFDAGHRLLGVVVDKAVDYAGNAHFLAVPSERILTFLQRSQNDLALAWIEHERLTNVSLLGKT